MAEDSEIGWTDNTHNHWKGCAKVSRGCRFCYAEELIARWEPKPAAGQPRQASVWGRNAPRQLTTLANRRKPYRWNRVAQQTGTRPRVFASSLADVFEDHPMVGPWRRELFAMIEETPYLRWMLLTKRIELAEEMTAEVWGKSWPANVWLGTSAEGQPEADQRLSVLLGIEGPTERFLSAEPLLEPVILDGLLSKGRYPLSLCIGGGESGHRARGREQLETAARLLRDTTAAAGVPFMWKQWGEYAPYYQLPADIQERRRPPQDPAATVRMGKKNADRILDGRFHDGVVRSWAAELADLGRPVPMEVSNV